MRETTQRVLMEGTVAGLVLYATVAIYFVVVNVVTGRPALETASLLGGALFAGVERPAQVTVTPGWVAAFNGVHLLASLLLGIIGSAVVLLIDRHRLAWYGLFYLVVAAFIMSFVLLGVLTVELTGVIGWGSLVASHLLGAVLAWGYLAVAHRQELRPRASRPGT